MVHGTELTERKRYYVCDYGYSNIPDVILRGADPIVNKDAWDRYYQENVINWWRRKATNRWNNLKQEGRLRTELEVWAETRILILSDR